MSQPRSSELTTIVSESTINMTAVQVDYRFFRRPRNVATVTIAGLLLYYVIGFGFNFGALSLDGLSTGDLVSFLLVDQFLIESVSVALLFASVVAYSRIFSIRRVDVDGPGILRHFLRFVPLALGVFFIINPVTQTLRFLFRHAGAYDWDVYRDVYLLDPSLYLTYTGVLAPLLVLGLGLDLITRLRERASDSSVTGPAPDRPEATVVGATVGGFEKLLSCRDVSCFGVDDRVYHAVTDEGVCRIHETLSDLEERLDPAVFVRIRRSTIINLEFVESYAHWKGGRYVVRMRGAGDVEHVIPRGNVRLFKKRMHSYCSRT